MAVKSGIYQILNIKNHKRYIGSAVNLKKRFSEHLKSLYQRTHYNGYLQNAFLKYGSDTFKFKILEYCDKEYLKDKELFWINFIKPEYNMIQAIPDRFIYTDEIKNKIREKVTKRWKNMTFLEKKNICEKISKSVKKPVLQFSIDGVFIKEYNSIKEAGMSLGLKPTQYSLISKVCKNREGRAKAYGFIWKHKIVKNEC